MCFRQDRVLKVIKQKQYYVACIQLCISFATIKALDMCALLLSALSDWLVGFILDSSLICFNSTDNFVSIALNEIIILKMGSKYMFASLFVCRKCCSSNGKKPINIFTKHVRFEKFQSILCNILWMSYVVVVVYVCLQKHTKHFARVWYWSDVY